MTSFWVCPRATIGRKRLKPIFVRFSYLLDISEELKIEVRDEDLNIPYDYYDILIRSAKDKIANIVYKFIEKEMLELKRKGIILGHYKGREIFHAEKPAPYDFDVL